MLYFSAVWLYQSSINVEIHSWIIPLSTGLGHVIIRMILNYKFFSSIWLRNLRTLWIEKIFSVFGALYFEKNATFGQIMKKSHIFRVQDDPSLILYLWSLPGLKKSRRDKWIWTKKKGRRMSLLLYVGYYYTICSWGVWHCLQDDERCLAGIFKSWLMWVQNLQPHGGGL